MTSSTNEEMNDLAAAVTQPKEFAPQPLWPNPNWSQEAAMIAFEIHRLREERNEVCLCDSPYYSSCPKHDPDNLGEEEDVPEGWNPMSTAPKDGRWILATWMAKERVQEKVHWSDMHRIWVHSGNVKVAPDGWLHIEGHELAAQWRTRSESFDRVGNHVIANVLRECANELEQYHE